MSLGGITVLISGSTRGIGRATAIAYGKAGANVIVTGKTNSPQTHIPYTIQDTAHEVEKAGGSALALEMDIRDDHSVASAIKIGMKHFTTNGSGSQLDILVNNAGYISLTNMENTSMHIYDLMNKVNLRGTYLMSKVCLPYFKGSRNPHIVSYCPPLDMNLGWFKNFSAYTVTKYGMSMYALGMSEEFKRYGIAVNGLWPRMVIATESVKNAIRGPADAIMNKCRKPEIMADATVLLTRKPSKTFTGNLLLDEEFLKAEGITDFEQYLVDPKAKTLFDGIYIPGVSHPMKDNSSSWTADPPKPIKLGEISQSIITKLNKTLQDGLLDSIDKSFLFVVLAGECTVKTFLINCSQKKIIEDVNDGDFDLKVTTNEETLSKIFSGKLNPIDALVEKQLRLQGDPKDGKQLTLMLSTYAKHCRQ